MELTTKNLLLKSLRLEKYFKCYEAGGSKKNQVIIKFEEVWGEEMTTHFLFKYHNAEDLISALDGTNLDLFIKKF